MTEHAARSTEVRPRPPVAVVAGTPFDSALGVRLLADRGVPAVAHPTASSPAEQDRRQAGDPGGLTAEVHRVLGSLPPGSIALVFCNSLGAVLDRGPAFPVPVVSPPDVQRAVAARFDRPLVLTGNGGALAGYEGATAAVSTTHLPLGVSAPALVRAIEAGGGDLTAAFRAAGTPAVLRAAVRAGADAVVLACTHFTAVADLVATAVDVPVVDIGAELVTRAATAWTAAHEGAVA